MARRCSCGYVIEDRWANGCPLCGAPLGGSAPARSGGGGSGFGSRTPLYLGLGLVSLLAVGGILLNRQAAGRNPAVGQQQPMQTDSTGRIRLGMHMNEVARVLDAEVARRPSAEGSLTSKFPEGMTKTGTLHWEKDRRVLVIIFDRGKVAFIHEHRIERAVPERFDIEYDDENPG